MPHDLIYRLSLWLLFPAIAAYTAAIALRDGSARYLAQRLGRLRRDDNDATQPLWIHCASVGETNAAMTLVETWLKRHPGDSVVLTTNTVTAARFLASRTTSDTIARVRHYYLPLDYPLFCRRFLSAVKPRCALIVETEIWLNLFSECRHGNIPLLIVNARLSQRTLDGARRFKAYYRQSLAAVTKILARNEKDAAMFAVLGVAKDKIEVVGNLKWAGKWTGEKAQTPPDLIGKRYVLAASTHEDEEIQVAEAWRRALDSRDRSDRPLLVIAPRHPRRGPAIARQLKKRGFNVQLRSRSQIPEDDTSVYIADTLGELATLIRRADLVFMGGSLVPVGGHNVLEPAQLGIPQAVGPYTHNFHEEVTALKAVGGLIGVADKNELEEVFRATLNKAPEHAAATQKALALMREHENVAEAYAAQIERVANVR